MKSRLISQQHVACEMRAGFNITLFVGREAVRQAKSELKLLTHHFLQLDVLEDVMWARRLITT